MRLASHRRSDRIISWTDKRLRSLNQGLALSGTKKVK
jgi:hypothetical protein